MEERVKRSEKAKSGRSLQEETTREQQYWKKNSVWTLLIFAALFVYSVFTGPNIAVEMTDLGLSLKLDDGTVCQIPYDSIESAELVDQPDFGTCIEGKDARRWKSGTFENELWGEYTVCAYTSSENCITVNTGTQTYVMYINNQEYKKVKVDFDAND